MPSIAQTETVVNLVDKAAAQSDRWLFLAILAVLLLFAGIVIKWLVNHIGKKDEAIVEKEKMFDAERVANQTKVEASRTEARQEFLKALSEQRTDFRAELALERAAVVSSLTRLAEVTMEHVKEARAVWRDRLPSTHPPKE